MENATADIFGKTKQDLEELAREIGLPRYAGGQIAGWLYGRNVADFEAMTNLSKEARQRLLQEYRIETPDPVKVHASADGTRKYLYRVQGVRYVEAAWIPEEQRSTLCLSTQVGCKMGCLFCMTGRQGFQANLTAGEIVNQYRSLPERDRVTNIVYMGMGEPFDNLDETMRSLEVFTAGWGYGMSPRRITVSTIGIIPAMKEFLSRSECRLAVSLHSPFDEERRSLMPIQHVYPLEEVIATVREADLSPQRRVSFEYILFDGVNDTPKHSRELVRLLSGLRCRVNLIPFHPIPGSPLKGSPAERMVEFENALKDKGIMTTIRRSRGLDIQAACGLLSTRELVKQSATDY